MRRADFLSELLAMRSRIEPLAEVKEVRARVLLNLGLVAYCFADGAGALRHFAAIDGATHDIDLRFLGRFLIGFVNAQAGNVTTSEVAYRSAYALLPNAQSAIIGLSEILFTTGRRGEAAELAERAIAAEAAGHPGGYLADPWLQFKVLGRLQPSDILSSLRQAVAK